MSIEKNRVLHIRNYMLTEWKKIDRNDRPLEQGLSLRALRLCFKRTRTPESKGLLAGGCPCRSKKRKRTLLRVSFWSGLRGEQIKTVDNCFYRSECAETRSEASKASLMKLCDYVSKRREPAEPLRGSWWVQSPCRSKKRKRTLLRVSFWSGLRGSNPPPPPWQGGALPNELNPQVFKLKWRLGWGSVAARTARLGRRRL